MKKLIFVLLIFAACNKSPFTTTPTYTTEQIIDSTGIVRGKIYRVQYVYPTGSKYDTIIFNSDNSITEITRRDSLTFMPVYFNATTYPAIDTDGHTVIGTSYKFYMHMNADTVLSHRFYNQLTKDTGIVYGGRTAKYGGGVKTFSFIRMTPPLTYCIF